MLKKKASCLAADIMRHGRKAESEMVPLTDNSTCGSSWSEQGTEETTSSTFAVVAEANRRGRQEEELDQQRQRRSRRASSAFLVASEPDDCQQSVPSVRGALPKPNRQQWSSMLFVQLSVVVVALAVAATIALVFALRDAEVQNQISSRPSDDDSGSDEVSGDQLAFEPGAIQRRSADVEDQARRATRKTNAAANLEKRVKLASGSSPSAGSAGKRGPSTFEIGRTAPSSPVGAGVVWLEDETLGQVRPEGFPPEPQGRASELDGERRRHSASPDDNTAYGVAKSRDNSSSTVLGKNANKGTFAKDGRNVKRLNRKAVLRKQGVMGLLDD
ncbi:uncharacterized protein [Dermacentor andersoni]|uniref:uncharacterized protein n=1 Tax=Dermacentor andersoni TaxID=34620 RepID=UPI0024179D4F|nr:uncharacterized protein LOC129383904 [Dermacentor andersoni]